MNWPCPLPTKHTHTHAHCPEWWRVFCVGETATAFRTNIDTCAATREGRGSQTKPKAVAIRWFIGQFAPPPLSIPPPPACPFPCRAQNKSEIENEIEQQLQLHRLTGHGQEERAARKQRAVGNTPLPHSPSKQGFNFGRWVSQLKRTLYRQPQPHPTLPQSFVINTGKKTKKLHEWKTLKVLWHDALSYSHASIRETICTFNALFISVFIVI